MPTGGGQSISAGCCLLAPCPANWMRFSVEDDSVEVKSSRRRKQEVEILEGLGEEETLHGIRFLFGHDALQCGVAFVGAAICDEVTPHRGAQLYLMTRVGLAGSRRAVRARTGVVIEIVRRFDDLRAEWIARGFNFHR